MSKESRWGKQLPMLMLGACLLSMAGSVQALTFSVGAELGAGVKHSDDGHAGFLRFMWLGEKGAGCGVVLGAWDGLYRNDVAGLTCEKRVSSASDGRPIVSAGLGLVALDRSPIVNSRWAAEIHLRFFLSRHVAFGITHFSNAGTSHPNRGFNFLSLELVF